MTEEKAILAGGCFWGMQELFRQQPGVISTRVGYTGGDVPNATYRNHGTHAEGLEIIFDPSQISYRKILEYFFQIHDPSTPNRQGNDIGSSYRSGIYYTTDEQKQTAEQTIADVNNSGLWPAKVATELAPAADFWQAEAEHQDYLQLYPTGYTCHFPRPDWKLPETKQDTAMTNETTQDEVVHDQANNRYVVKFHDGEEGEFVYQRNENILSITRIEAPASRHGQGLGARIMEAVLPELEKAQFKATPVCSYAVRYLQKHTQWSHLISD